MENKTYPYLLASSISPEQVSTRVKGIALALSSIIIFLAGHFFGIKLTPVDMLDLATQVGMVSGAIWTIFGFIMRVLATFKK
jgi:hypothetical protein